jgi:hypothetical protein
MNNPILKDNKPMKTVITSLVVALFPLAALANEPQKPQGNWQTPTMQKMDVAQLGKLLGRNLKQDYDQYQKDLGFGDDVTFNVAQVDLNRDGKKDLLLLAESRYHCGQMGCNLLVYLAPLNERLNPFDLAQPDAVFNYQAMDVMIDTSVPREAADILVYDGVAASYVPFMWDARQNAYVPR